MARAQASLRTASRQRRRIVSAVAVAAFAETSGASQSVVRGWADEPASYAVLRAWTRGTALAAIVGSAAGADPRNIDRNRSNIAIPSCGTPAAYRRSGGYSVEPPGRRQSVHRGCRGASHGGAGGACGARPVPSYSFRSTR
jgi:hypothetical protein